MKQQTKKKSKIRIVLLSVLLLTTASFMAMLYLYQLAHAPKVNVGDKERTLFITDLTHFDALCDQLEKDSIISSENEFRIIARLKRFNFVPKNGRYVIKQNENYSNLINILRIGNRTPIKLTFNNVRTKEELAGVISSYLQFDSLEMLSVLNNDTFLSKFNLTSHSVVSIFIPNTYQIYWNSSPQAVVERFNREYNLFWNEERRNKAKSIGLTTMEVITLASIVEEETIIAAEKPVVAGLYINRLKRGIMLQADPTLRFALNNFEIKRVLNVHKLVDSPYNTYKYKGLPPGPIRLPEPSSIDAVLNYTTHSYLYMVAKPDFSGQHHFSKTLKEHNYHADIYRRELNKRRIYK